MKKRTIKALKQVELNALLTSNVEPYHEYDLLIKNGRWDIADDMGTVVARGKVSKKGMKQFQAVLERITVLATGGSLH